MTFKVSGILTDVFPIERYSDNFFKKVFWLKQPDSERYPQHWSIELHQNDTERLAGIHVGDKLECEIELRGKKSKRRDGEEYIINTLKCVGILVMERVDVVPGKLGTFKPKPKPGREADTERPKAQGELGL